MGPDVDINIDRGPQQTLDTENPWLDVIIIHSKFISSPLTWLFIFLQLFQYFLPFVSLLNNDEYR